MVRNAFLHELESMSSAERILLAQDLWDSISDDAESWNLTATQKRLLDRRLKAIASRKRAGKNAGSTWAQAKRRILASV